VISYYPAPHADTPENSLYVAAAQVRDRRNLEKGLPQLASVLDRYHPAQAGMTRELGQGYRAAEKLTQEIPYFEEAARREPTDFRLVPTPQMDAGQFPQAESTLRRATVLSPENPMAWGTLGWGALAAGPGCGSSRRFGKRGKPGSRTAATPQQSRFC
jgi:hypothetical protein